MDKGKKNANALKKRIDELREKIMLMESKGEPENKIQKLRLEQVEKEDKLYDIVEITV